MQKSALGAFEAKFFQNKVIIISSFVLVNPMVSHIKIIKIKKYLGTLFEMHSLTNLECVSVFSYREVPNPDWSKFDRLII